MKARIFAKPSAKLAAGVILSAVSLLLASCFYMPGVSGGKARAGVSVNRSLLPSNISSFALVVGGPGMEPIVAQYPVGTTSATLSVPSGVARTFTFIANTPSVTFEDSVTVDLAPDEAKDISLTPVLAASQIIAPDYFNSQLVQISDMMGTGWKNLVDVTNGLNPYDVDFDNQGRMYIGDRIRGMLVTTDIGQTPVALTGATFSSVTGITIDRLRGLLYYTGFNVNGQPALGRLDLAKSTEQQTLLSSIIANPSAQGMTGIAVDSAGFVYLATDSTATPAAAILKVDLTTFTSPNVVKTYADSKALLNPWDILVKDGFVYVSDFAGRQIIRLDQNLSFVDSLSGKGSDSFKGPERFVAILNKPITVIDEGGTTVDRLVAFGDMTGAGWTTYGATGFSGTPGLFSFYNALGS